MANGESLLFEEIYDAVMIRSHNNEAVVNSDASLFSIARRIVEKDPSESRAYFIQAVLLFKGKKYNEAEECIYKAIDMDVCGRPEMYVLAGDIYKNNNKNDLSLECYESAYKLDSSSPEICWKLGSAYLSRRAHEKALMPLEAAVNLSPNNIAFLMAFGNALSGAGKTENAVRVFKNIRDRCQNESTLIDAGNALYNLKSYVDALDTYTKALNLSPGNSAIYMNAGASLKSLNQHKKAVKMYKSGLCINPDSCGIYYNIGNALKDDLKCQEADKYYKRSLIIKYDDPKVHWNRSFALLTSEDLKNGFSEYEWRWDFEGFPSKKRNFKEPMWDGSDFHGKRLLIHAEQGAGDTLQFIRYLDLVKQKGDHIILELQNNMVELFDHGEFSGKVYRKYTELPDFDLQIPMMSLPYVFKTEIDNIPNKVPYIYTRSDVKVSLPEASPDKLNVGIVWSGNPDQANDINRSANLDEWSAILDVTGVRIFSLQKGHREHQHTMYPSMIPLSDRLKSYSHTAEFIKKLDLVISVCTSVCHLSGALGHPTWTLLCYASDWRWHLEREDCPWYPTMRLFRQRHRGDWREVSQRVAQALTNEAQNPEGFRKRWGLV